jgi:hypothetical protein
MKVKIGKYPNWLGPYQLVEKIFFWARQKDEYGIEREADWVYSIGDWLSHTWFGGWWSGVANSWTDYHGKRQVKVRIDPWDTWSMDHTLAHIVVPMLVQLKETTHGAPYVDPKDVPAELQPKKLTKKQKDDGETDTTHFERWDWVLDEMIFAFESKHNDWEEQFHSGEVDRVFKDLENGYTEWLEGPNHTFKIDMKGYKAYQKRISNGFRLFGKYYENLWD